MEQSAVDEMIAWQGAVRLENVAKALIARGFEAEVCATRDEARTQILVAAETAKTIGFGGSLSVACLNVTRDLSSAGKEILNHGFKDLTPDERMEIMRRQLTCDLFLSSVNALTDDGIIVNVDGIGNRVASMTFGPHQVLLIVGRNKVVRGSVSAALNRIREVAGPINCYRLGRKTPCAITGVCADCAGVCPESICRVTSIIRQRPGWTPIRVLLVNEDLGL
ncbi:MAG: lactate utilization protein [Kiritimatiellia bacterium]